MKVTIDSRSEMTPFKNQTNNPTFKFVLEIKEIYLYGSIDFIKSNPPEVLIEIFDADLIAVFDLLNILM